MKRAATSRATGTRKARVRVGIGSWADAEYTGVLYPKGLASEKRLETYATWFDHVEVNASYYRTPDPATVASWVKQTPRDFLFNVKLHRAFSQSPAKTAIDAAFVRRWLKSVEPLITARKLGAFLLVLPPNFGPERRRLDELDALVDAFAPHRLAVELRHSGWVAANERERTLDYFRERQLVWVTVDMPRVKGSSIMPVVTEVTNRSLAYVRLHGRNKQWLDARSAAERHTYLYTTAALRDIATRVRALAEKAREVHVVANNHAQDFAPKTALALKRLLTSAARQQVVGRKSAAVSHGHGAHF